MPASERVAPKPASLRTRRFATLAAVAALGVAGWLPTSYFMSLLVREQLGGGIAGAALVIGTMHLSRAIGAAITGRWVTRLESRAVYALGLAGMTTLMVMLVLAPDVAWVIVAAPLAGLSMAYFWAGLQTYVIEIAPPSRRGGRRWSYWLRGGSGPRRRRGGAGIRGRGFRFPRVRHRRRKRPRGGPAAHARGPAATDIGADASTRTEHQLCAAGALPSSDRRPGRSSSVNGWLCGHDSAGRAARWWKSEVT